MDSVIEAVKKAEVNVAVKGEPPAAPQSSEKENPFSNLVNPWTVIRSDDQDHQEVMSLNGGVLFRSFISGLKFLPGICVDDMKDLVWTVFWLDDKDYQEAANLPGGLLVRSHAEGIEYIPGSSIFVPEIQILDEHGDVTIKTGAVSIC